MASRGHVEHFLGHGAGCPGNFGILVDLMRPMIGPLMPHFSLLQTGAPYEDPPTAKTQDLPIALSNSTSLELFTRSEYGF